MSKANDPAYPVSDTRLEVFHPGISQREKLAMEIYERMVSDHRHLLTDEERNLCADYSLRAADIFFEQLNK